MLEFATHHIRTLDFHISLFCEMMLQHKQRLRNEPKEKWVTQINAGDIFNHTMSGYESKTGVYKDGAIGDTPKIYWIDINELDHMGGGNE